MADDNFKDKVKAKTSKMLHWVRDNVPPGLRLLLGVLLIIGGVFGFLPILGFWMIPLGIAIAAYDIKPVLAAIRDRLK